MKRKLNSILLIDDDDATNFIHSIIIKKTGLCEKVVAIQNAKEALTYLCTKEDDDYPSPDLIFLDINMPEMNGWEFLEEYNKLVGSVQEKIIIMLTSSINPKDKDRAMNFDTLHGFKHKPLTIDMLEELNRDYFSN